MVKGEAKGDRGQVFQARVVIRRVLLGPGGTSKIRVLLLGFNNREVSSVDLEVETEGCVVRTVQVSYDQLREAFEELTVTQSAVNLAAAAANKLMLFGDDLELLWSGH